MDLERIIGSIVTENGPQPFVLHTQSGKLEVGRYTEADEAQADLTITQQQRFVQLIAERADITFAKVRLGQYYDGKNDQWVDVLREAWSGPLEPLYPATPTLGSVNVFEATPAAPVEVVEAVEATPTAPVEAAPAAPVEAVEAVEATPAVPVEVVEAVEASPAVPVEAAAPVEAVEVVEEEPPALAEEFEVPPPAPVEAVVPAAPVVVEEAAEAETVAPAALVAEQTPEPEAPPSEPKAPPLEPEAPPLEWEAAAEARVMEDRASDDEAFIDAVLLPNEAVMLEKAIRIAVEAHGGQLDKAGDLYILHPLRMMLQMPAPTEMMAAVLHDIVEDTGWTLEALRHEGFSETVVEAVDSLTRRPGESYEAFIERAARHSIARRVKLADLEDNMNVRRLDALTDQDQARLARYLTAWRKLRDGGV